MTREEHASIDRLVGQLQAQHESAIAWMNRVDAKLDAADEWRGEVKKRLERMEESDVSVAFTALQQSIRDGKMQVKGALVGMSLAAGAAGATVATGIKWLWAALTGA